VASDTIWSLMLPAWAAPELGLTCSTVVCLLPPAADMLQHQVCTAESGHSCRCDNQSIAVARLAVAAIDPD
jgi:hypothetical protein